MYPTIIIQDQGMITTEPVPVTTLATTLSSALIGSVLQVKEQIPETEREETYAEMFDIFNTIFSNALDTMFPETCLRPDLTEQAILDAENAIIAKEHSKVAGPVLQMKQKKQK